MRGSKSLYINIQECTIEELDYVFQSHGDLLWKAQVFEHMQSVNKCICAIIIISATH
jgi:hypothetical protein